MILVATSGDAVPEPLPGFFLWLPGPGIASLRRGPALPLNGTTENGMELQNTSPGSLRHWEPFEPFSYGP